MNHTDTEAQQAFLRLSTILDTLRRECPWDRSQTLKSLRHLTIEEVYELSDAIVALETKHDPTAPLPTSPSEATTQGLKKELGDLAMHILFYCKIAEEEGLFSTADVYNTVCEKLISRHPFIYQREAYRGESWEQLKMRESDHRHALAGVPDKLPSLIKAIRIQEKIAGRTAGSPQADIGLTLPIDLPDDTTEADFGNLLFGMVDWARRHGINADDALCQANTQFANAHH